MGSKWAQGVVEEWVGDKDPVMRGLKGSMYGRARGGAVEQIRDRCREAAIQEPGQIAEAATLVMMELLWGHKASIQAGSMERYNKGSTGGGVRRGDFRLHHGVWEGCYKGAL